jgi:TRAP-type C4-dicarboxylate transport system substrate-binding protein
MSDVKVCMLFYDGGGTIHANKKIMRPADLKGMKVRSPNATAARLYRAAGASTIQVSAAEAAQALERGVADALSFPWNLLIHLGIDRVVHKHMDINFYSLGTAVLINKGAYAKLSGDQKKVIDGRCTPEWAEKMPPEWVAWELEGREKLLADPKHEVYKISDADLAEWTALKQDAFVQWKKDVKDRGYDPEVILSELNAKIEQYGAGY